MRPIDADKLKEVFAVPSYEAFGVTTICSIIDDAPTVDAEPVRHGKSIIKKVDAIFSVFTCSECGKCVKAVNGYYGEPTKDIANYYPYCHCGAKMDLE